MALDNRERLLTALRNARWNLAEAARQLGVSRTAVNDAIKRHKIRRLKPREPAEVVSARKRHAALVRWRS